MTFQQLPQLLKRDLMRYVHSKKLLKIANRRTITVFLNTQYESILKQFMTEKGLKDLSAYDAPVPNVIKRVRAKKRC